MEEEGILLQRNNTTSSSLRLPTTVIECKADDLSHKTRSSISMKRTNFHCLPEAICHNRRVRTLRANAEEQETKLRGFQNQETKYARPLKKVVDSPT